MSASTEITVYRLTPSCTPRNVLDGVGFFAHVITLNGTTITTGYAGDASQGAQVIYNQLTHLIPGDATVTLQNGRTFDEVIKREGLPQVKVDFFDALKACFELPGLR